MSNLLQVCSVTVSVSRELFVTLISDSFRNGESVWGKRNQELNLTESALHGYSRNTDHTEKV